VDELQTLLAQVPAGWSLFVTDLQGQVIARYGVDAESARLHKVTATSDGQILGSQKGRRFLEARYRMEGRLAPMGTLHVRRPLAKPLWAGSVPTVAMGGGAFLALFTFLWLSFAFRGVSQFRRVLSRASKEEFFHRAPLVGCGEMKSMAWDLNRTLDSLTEASVRVRNVYVETALALSRTVEAKDKYTSGHSQRVARHAVELGEAVGLDGERLEMLRIGALLHDIGKVAVPDAVLLKPGALDDAEYEEMKRHPMAGDRILAAIPGLRDIADIARSHHERWDGAGYPMGAVGDAIPLEARIVGIADAYDALTTKRSYKEAMPVERALKILEKDAGSHFDPELVRLFVAKKRSGDSYKGVSGLEAQDRQAA
jgi:putative nucleotidyltransferase with HDIG domain